jgi:hypothetical protein
MPPGRQSYPTRQFVSILVAYPAATFEGADSAEMLNINPQSIQTSGASDFVSFLPS